MTKAQLGYWKSYCSEPLENIENYQQALAENFKGWDIHHRLEIQKDGTRMSRQELKDNKLYYGRPASELVFMRHGEHIALHMTCMKRSTDTCKKIAEAKKGENNPFFGKHHTKESLQKMSESLSGENHPFFGKHHSEESRQKMSEAHKGKHLSEKSRQRLSEAICGMLWWNNGVSNKKARECPGEGWKRGRLKASSSNL